MINASFNRFAALGNAVADATSTAAARLPASAAPLFAFRCATPRPIGPASPKALTAKPPALWLKDATPASVAKTISVPLSAMLPATLLLDGGCQFVSEKTAHLEELGVPPALALPAALWLVGGKLPTLALMLSPMALAYNVANVPRVALSLHIESVNRDLPAILKRFDDAPIAAITSEAQAREASQRLQILHPFTKPHPVETKSCGWIKRGQKPFLARTWPLSWLYSVIAWPRRKIQKWLEKKDTKMGPNDRLGELNSLERIRKRAAKIRILFKTLRGYENWKLKTWRRLKVGRRGGKWDPSNPLFLPDKPGESFEKVFQWLVQSLRYVKQKTIRNGIVVMKGIETIADYAGTELTPEAVNARAMELGVAVEKRLTFLNAKLSDPRWVTACSPADWDALGREIGEYDGLTTGLYRDYPAAEIFIPAWVQAAWLHAEGTRLRSNASLA